MSEGGQTEARRRLGVPTLAAIVVANMIDAGVFTTSGFALADLGSRGWVMLAWVVGGVLAILGALCYGALAAHLRGSGGEYLFLSRTLHPRIGFLAGWISLFAGFTGAIAVAAEAVEAYLRDWLPESLPTNSLGTVLILAAGALHAVRLGPGAKLQNGAVLAKIALLILMVLVGARVLLDGDRELVEVVTVSAPSWGTFATTLMWISLSYSGWNAAVYIAGEARDPQRSLPRALLLGSTAVIALYLAWNAVVLWSAPMEELAGRPDVAAAAAESLAGSIGAAAVKMTIALALRTSVSSMVMIGPRVYAQMAEDGALPRWFAFRGETPRVAILLQVVLSIALLHAYDLRAQLTNLGWILSLCAALAVVGLLRERKRVGADQLPIPGGPAVAWLFLIATVGLAVVALQANPGRLSYAAGVLISGAVASLFIRPRWKAAS